MFENMTVSSLESLLKATYDKLLEVKLADPPNQTAVETLQTDLIEIANAIKSKTAEKIESKTADLGAKKTRIIFIYFIWGLYLFIHQLFICVFVY